MPDPRAELIRAALAVCEEGLSEVYNEGAFRFLLAIERIRSERSCSPCLLILVDLLEQRRGISRIDSVLAGELFANLSPCLRDTDFVGWYSEGSIAGAVVTDGEEGCVKETARLIGQRVASRLRDAIAPRVSGQLRVRIYRTSGSKVSGSEDEIVHCFLVPSKIQRSLFRKWWWRQNGSPS